MNVPQTIKAIIPNSLLKVYRRVRLNVRLNRFRNVSTQEVFSLIYEEGIWGNSKDKSRPFFSGSGSDDSVIVSSYIQAMRAFLSTLDRKPKVVDLGCGDFTVSSKIRDLCDTYIACDIVPQLVKFNKETYKELDVDFKVIDFTTEAIPSGDIVIIRQVLQHLSNSQIMQVIPKLISQYKYVILTEHLPDLQRFEHNDDITSGPETRLGFESGVVLTSAPFNLKAKSERVLCQVPESNGVITTTVYQLSE
jgi:2-polyprenyl-3-methyl-5-hydroxy-6-metoxy-1,4-benzoquinol methylase